MRTFGCFGLQLRLGLYFVLGFAGSPEAGGRPHRRPESQTVWISLPAILGCAARIASERSSERCESEASMKASRWNSPSRSVNVPLPEADLAYTDSLRSWGWEAVVLENSSSHRIARRFK